MCVKTGECMADLTFKSSSPRLEDCFHSPVDGRRGAATRAWDQRRNTMWRGVARGASRGT